MSIYSNENIRKIVKLSPHKLLQLLKHQNLLNIFLLIHVSSLAAMCDHGADERWVYLVAGVPGHHGGLREAAGGTRPHPPGERHAQETQRR